MPQENIYSEITGLIPAQQISRQGLKKLKEVGQNVGFSPQSLQKLEQYAGKALPIVLEQTQRIAQDRGLQDKISSALYMVSAVAAVTPGGQGLAAAVALLRQTPAVGALLDPDWQGWRPYLNGAYLVYRTQTRKKYIEGVVAGSGVPASNPIARLAITKYVGTSVNQRVGNNLRWRFTDTIAYSLLEWPSRAAHAVSGGADMALFAVHPLYPFVADLITGGVWSGNQAAQAVLDTDWHKAKVADAYGYAYQLGFAAGRAIQGEAVKLEKTIKDTGSTQSCEQKAYQRYLSSRRTAFDAGVLGSKVRECRNITDTKKGAVSPGALVPLALAFWVFK